MNAPLPLSRSFGLPKPACWGCLRPVSPALVAATPEHEPIVCTECAEHLIETKETIQ